MRPKKKFIAVNPKYQRVTVALKNASSSGGTASAENFYQLGRRSFITGMFAILMIPVSTAVGYYINKTLQRPELTIAVVDSTQYTEDQTLQESAFNFVKSDMRLLAYLRELITRLQPNDSSCADWLSDRKEWHNRCITVVDQSITGLLDANRAQQISIQTNIKLLETWLPGDPLPLQPMQEPRTDLVSATAFRNKAAAIGMLQGPLDFLKAAEISLINFSDALREMKAHDSQLSGEVDFDVGVLNNGDSDGFVFNIGKLKFDIGELWIYADTYTVVKAHSFQKITFHIGTDEQDNAILSEWKKSVINRNRLGGQVLLKTSNEKYFQRDLKQN